MLGGPLLPSSLCPVGSWPAAPVQLLFCEGRRGCSPLFSAACGSSTGPQLRLSGPSAGSQLCPENCQGRLFWKGDPGSLRSAPQPGGGGRHSGRADHQRAASAHLTVPCPGGKDVAGQAWGQGQTLLCRLLATRFVFLKPQVFIRFYTIGFLKRTVNLNPVGFQGAV